jgi:hypothetical protein
VNWLQELSRVCALSSPIVDVAIVLHVNRLALYVRRRLGHRKRHDLPPPE